MPCTFKKLPRKDMNNIVEKFPDEVATKLGNYVYRLIDPRNGETFYVGKGTKNRVFDHALDTLKFKSEEEDELSLKRGRIKEILNANLQVLYVIHRHDIPDESIFEVEAAVIDAFPGLTNTQGGHGSGAKGPMNVLELMDKYALPEISDEPTDKLVLININNLENRSCVKEVYKQVRLAWRISRTKAEQADYILAVVRGVVVGAFIAEEWLDATNENFPIQISIDNESPERKGFHGKRAPDAIWERYVGSRGKRIAIDKMKHNQYPIRYWNI
jgi:hypothetical protein